jgi:hypothetical protein
MKKTILAIVLVAASLTQATETPQEQGLYARDQKQGFVNVAQLIDEAIDFQAQYKPSDLCFVGNAGPALRLLLDYSKNTDYFFSGGGGGFKLESARILNGVAYQMIEMKLSDEVVRGEFQKVHINPCRVRKIQ